MGGNVLELESDRLIKEGMERGLRAVIETYRENHFSEEKLKKQLMEKFELTETEALKYMKKY